MCNVHWKENVGKWVSMVSNVTDSFLNPEISVTYFLGIQESYLKYVTEKPDTKIILKKHLWFLQWNPVRAP